MKMSAFGKWAASVMAALAACFVFATAAHADGASAAPSVAGHINWGIWVDADGCQHWWADGGLEGYMVDRVDPRTGHPICAVVNRCFVGNTDQLFDTDSSHLTPAAVAQLKQFFQSAGAFGYAVYGHTDSRASDAYNIGLSQRRAKAVADVGRSVGAPIVREIGYGERQPIATNATPQGMQLNRRVEIVCYTW